MIERKGKRKSVEDERRRGEMTKHMHIVIRHHLFKHI